MFLCVFDNKIATKCCNKFLEYNTLLKVKVFFIAECQKCCYVAFFNVPFQRWTFRLLLFGFPMGRRGKGGGGGREELFRNFSGGNVPLGHWDN